jgi:hypothetical protein
VFLHPKHVFCGRYAAKIKEAFSKVKSGTPVLFLFFTNLLASAQWRSGSAPFSNSAQAAAVKKTKPRLWEGKERGKEKLHHT